MTHLARAAEATVIDTNAKLSASEAMALYSACVRTVWRYVFFEPARGGDLDMVELATLLSAGLTVCVAQHVRMPGWHSGGRAMGVQDAEWAIRNAEAAGYGGLPGLALCFDAEGVGNPGPDVVDHVAAWCEIVHGAVYQPVVYVGYDSGLRGSDLDALPGEPLFWCDFAPMGMRPQPARGFVGHQQAQTTLCGISVDVDAVLVPDALVGLGDGDVNLEPSDARETPAPPTPDNSGTT